MRLADINVLVYAYREDAADHAAYRQWLQAMVDSQQAFAMSDLVLSGFLRVVTHPRVFDPPSPLAGALEFVEAIRSAPNCVPLSPGDRHWEIFVQLCEAAGAKGNLLPDAYLAAMAIESGSEWITTDRDFSRFPELRWHHPLEG